MTSLVVRNIIRKSIKLHSIYYKMEQQNGSSEFYHANGQLDRLCPPTWPDFQLTRNRFHNSSDSLLKSAENGGPGPKVGPMWSQGGSQRDPDL